MCLVVNCQCGFFYIFYYIIYGVSLENKVLVCFICKWILLILILYILCDEYVKLYVNEYYSVCIFNIEYDVDLVFMKQYGFYKGMFESVFWICLVFVFFYLVWIFEYLKFCFDVSFVFVLCYECVSWVFYWVVLFGLVYVSGYLEVFVLFYLFLIFIFIQYLLWIQYVFEYFWFVCNEYGLLCFLYYGLLSWGCFFGCFYLVDKQGLVFVLVFVCWSLGVLLIDILLWVFFFMQDLFSYDFYYCKLGVNFWCIVLECVVNEVCFLKFGLMIEIWGMWENFLILCDYFCCGQLDLFGIVDWYCENYVWFVLEIDVVNQFYIN